MNAEEKTATKRYNNYYKKHYNAAMQKAGTDIGAGLLHGCVVVFLVIVVVTLSCCFLFCIHGEIEP